MRLFILTFFLCLFLHAPAAFADCVSDCQASTYCGSDSWSCAHDQQACYDRECNGSHESAAYGAIAYDKNSGAYGLSDGSPDKGSAKKSALRFCGQHGKDCEIVDTFSNTCAAIAQDKNGDVAGWGIDDSKKDAAKQAMKKCDEKAEGTGCYVSISHCFRE